MIASGNMKVSVSFNRRRSRGERVGGDYGTLRTDYSAPTFGRGRRHHQDSMRRLALVDISVSALEGAARGDRHAASRTRTSREPGLGRVNAEARGPRGAAVPVRRRRAAVQHGPSSSRRSRAASRTRTHFEPLRAYARPTTFIKAGGPAPYAVDAPSWPCGL